MKDKNLDQLIKLAYENQINKKLNDSIEQYTEILSYNLQENIRKVIYYNLGLCYMDIEDYSSAIQYFNISNNIKFDFNNLWHISLCQLYSNDWNNGRNLYYNRYKTTNDTSVMFPNFPIEQLYSKIDIKNKNILIMNEQGFGDEIMFSTQFEKLSKIVKSATIKVSKELLPLFEHLYKFSNIKFSTFDSISYEEISKFDGYVAMGDLFMFLYNIGDSLSLNLYKKNKSNKIGICWKANISSPNSDLRTIDKEYFSDIKNKVSLQYGENFNPGDFLETFNIILKLKEVQTIDTSIAHLCGLIGIPTTLIINKHHDWRWRYYTNENYSLFYPNIKIIKI
jgi:hypothetical protein